MKRVMLIDDDRSLHVAMEELLTANGYAYLGAFSGREGIETVRRERPDLLLLDVMLPDVNGFDICASVRADGLRLPIIFLSAKGDIVDKSVGYKAGGDDYVTKPFDSAELMLRILAGIRRGEGAGGDAVLTSGKFVIGNLELRFAEHEGYVRGRRASLTSKEFDILAMLASNAGTVFTRKQIYERVWGEQMFKGEGSVTVFIRRIREKIEDNPSDPKYLLTAHGIGYKIPDKLD